MSELTLPPSTWCGAVAAPHRKSSGNEVVMQGESCIGSRRPAGGGVQQCRPEPGTDTPEERYPMTDVMKGVRVLEVAEHTFVPAASALLADWGAEVIKIEPVERGDAMRGLASTGLAIVPNNIHVLMEHSNRGKRSLG